MREYCKGITVELTYKNIEIKWLSLKLVRVKTLCQWENLKKHFLCFLSKEKQFKREITPTCNYA